MILNCTPTNEFWNQESKMGSEVRLSCREATDQPLGDVHALDCMPRVGTQFNQSREVDL